MVSETGVRSWQKNRCWLCRLAHRVAHSADWECLGILDRLARPHCKTQSPYCGPFAGGMNGLFGLRRHRHRRAETRTGSNSFRKDSPVNGTSEGQPGQWHLRNGLPADERLVSLRRSGPGRPEPVSRNALHPLPWRFSGVGADRVPVGRSRGFDASCLTPVRGCEYRSRATRRVKLGRLPGRHGLARARPSQWAGHERATPVAVRAVRPDA